MKTSKIGVFLTGGAAIAIAVGILVLPMVFSENAVKEEVRTYFNSTTGMQLQISGDTMLKLLPIPHVIINGLYVENSANTEVRQPYLLKIKSMDVWPDFTSLFTGNVHINKLQAQGVDVELEMLSNGKMNWQDLYPAEGTKTNAKSLSVPDIHVTDGHITYQNIPFNTVLEVTDVNGYISNSRGFFGLSSERKASFSLAGNYAGNPVTASGHIDGEVPQLFTAAGVPLKITMSNNKNSLTYEGVAGSTNNHIILNGGAQFTAEDLTHLINVYRGVTTAEAAHKKLPLTAELKFGMKNDNKEMVSDVTLGGAAKGSFNAVTTFPDKMEVKASLTALDLETFIESGFATSFKLPETNGILVSHPQLPSNMSVSLDMKVHDMLYNDKHIIDTHFTTDINGTELTIPEFFATLPGETRLAFAGIGKVRESGLTLEGQIDAQGSDFIEAVNIFKSKLFALPRDDFKRFHFRANALISPKEIRLSELAARIENITTIGEIKTTFGQHTESDQFVDSALLINGLNLDHLVTLWGIADWENSLAVHNTLGSTSDGFLTVWLKRLSYSMQLNTSLENYTLGGKAYNKGNFTLSVGTNKLELDGKNVPYRSLIANGKVQVDVSKDVPEVDIKGDIDNFDADDIFSQSAAAGTNPRWSSEQCDLKFLDLMNSKYDITFGHFKYKLLDVQNVAIAGTLLDRKLSIDSLKATASGANIAGKGVIIGGTIPTFTLAMNITNARIENFANAVPLLANVSGIYNIILQLSTNGISPLSWISNLQGTAGIGGRDIMVRNLNLPGIIQAVNYVRTVADVLNVVKRSFSKGTTLFTSLEGQWSIAKGILETSDTKVSNYDATGTLNSKINIIDWTMDTFANFSLKTLDKAHPPTMTIKMIGNIDNPTFDFDTSSLEQYVSNKTSQKMIENYGAR